MNVARKILSRAKSSYAIHLASGALAPLRPIVTIQSDDWGRVGLPSRGTVGRLEDAGAKVGSSKWDYYGLETESDVVELGNILEGFRDRDGNCPRITANFVMANADLQRMRDEHFAQFRWIGIASGFPWPWTENLMPAYRAIIDRGVFEPGLHGFTHFNSHELMECLQEDSDRGRRARLLVEFNVPYLASFTPEYNFALVSRGRRERFLNAPAQEDWIKTGIALYTEAFGRPPRTACAPGYRANPVTTRLWRKLGIESVQSVGIQPLVVANGLLEFNRNVEFEPVLNENDAVSRALHQAEQAVLRGTPIVICTHSINYVTRFVGGAERSRELLRQLITSLLERFPDLRFAGAAEISDAWKQGRDDWFSAPSTHQRSSRRRSLSAGAITDEHAA